MVRFLYGSDIHVEFPKHAIPPLPPAEDYDAVILAGDLGYAEQGLKALVRLLPDDKRIIFVPGNHEYYKQPSINQVNQALEKFAADYKGRVTILNPGFTYVEDVRVVGATLWSDLRLRGEILQNEEAYDAYIERNISDFHLIWVDWPNGQRRRFNSQDCKTLHTIHRNATDFGSARIKQLPNEKIVVVTHFVPTQQALDPRFLGSSLNAYFINDCDQIMEENKPTAWVFGHTHTSYEGVHPSGVRLYCNPFGYPGENTGERAPRWKIFEA